MSNDNKPTRLPVSAPSYGAGGGNFYYDRTGAIYQTWVGRTSNPGAWGAHVYRTALGGKPQLLFFIEGINGALEVMNRELWFGYCDAKGAQWMLRIDGYIDPDDRPSTTIVDVDEAQVAGLKLSISTAQATADNATRTAMQSKATADSARDDVRKLSAQVAALTANVAAMQAQAVTRAQVEDIVWAKIWDINYLIRLGFIEGKSNIDNVQLYLTDLASYIRRITKV